MKTLLLIDGHAIMHRAFFALPELTTKSGIPTNAIYGFFTMVHKAIIDFQATHVIVAFDTPVKTFRKKMYADYQIHRPRPADSFIVQVPIIQELLDVGGIKRMEKAGFEADDVIGTLARKLREQFDKILILTGDRDLLQLVNDNTFVITPLKGISTSAIYDKEAVKEKFGVSPAQIPDLKALMGDASDNYGGAKGIGPKTASKLIQEYSDVESLLAHVEDIEPDRIRELIRTHKDNIILSKQLASIMTDVDVHVHIDDCAFMNFRPELEDKLKEYDFNSLLNRFFRTKAPEKKVTKSIPRKKDNPDQEGLF